MMQKLSSFILLALAFASCTNNQNNMSDTISPADTIETLAYPKTAKGDVIDDYFGTKVPDPYRWLENDTSAETKAWVIEENKVTDNYLSKIPKDEDINSFRHNRNLQFLLNQKLDNSKTIEELHNQLYSNKLIDSTLDNFKSHFNKNWDLKIQWLGTELQIVNFVNLLIENDILDKETQNFKYKLIASHFTNKKGNNFNEKQLGSVYSDKKEMIPTDDITFTIIKNLIKNK